jgi:signal peptidase I
LAVAAWLLPVRIGVVTGNSMDPTLRDRQIVAVDRGYYRRHRLAVGDVVLFRGEHGVYVKRVHALPGETVHLVEAGDGAEAERLPVARGEEREIAARLAGNRFARLRQVPVPEGTFFALGDALQNSEDSRDFGPVPQEEILGRVLPIGASLAAPELPARDTLAHRFDDGPRLPAHS